MKEEIITVVILEGGKSCREITSLESSTGYIELRTFEIESCYIIHGEEKSITDWNDTDRRFQIFKDITFPVGSTHPAVVVNDKMVRIV